MEKQHTTKQDGLSSIERKYFFPCHQLSAKPTHLLSADSVFTHLYNSFVMGLPVVNTSPGGQLSACVHHFQVRR